MPVARIFHILRGKRYIFCGRLLTCVFRGLCALILLSFLNECLSLSSRFYLYGGTMPCTLPKYKPKYPDQSQVMKTSN